MFLQQVRGPLAAMALLVAISPAANAQDGFAVGKTATFKFPPGAQKGATVSGVILELSRNLTLIAQPGANGAPPTPYLRPNWNEIRSFRKTGERWRYVGSTGAFTRDVYEVSGSRVSGKFVFEDVGTLRVKDGAGKIHVAWANYEFLALGGTPTSGGGQSTGQQQQSIQSGGPIAFRDPGQDFGGGLRVDYPSRVEGYMSQGDYDMFVFDFPGGSFTALSTGGLNLVADLWDARSGKSIARAMALSGSLSMTMPSLPPGRYGLQVRVMNQAGTGDYGLVLGGGGKLYREAR
jgi:hypothetical protein